MRESQVRCVKGGIDLLVWQSWGSDRAGSLAFVTADSAVANGLQSFSASCRESRGQLTEYSWNSRKERRAGKEKGKESMECEEMEGPPRKVFGQLIFYLVE